MIIDIYGDSGEFVRFNPRDFPWIVPLVEEALRQNPPKPVGDVPPFHVGVSPGAREMAIRHGKIEP